jgi:hypothetical protein
MAGKAVISPTAGLEDSRVLVGAGYSPPVWSDRFVGPFYLQMMRTNAVEHGPALLPALVAIGRTATAREVIALLRDPWRCSVMGAWFALLHDDAVVTTAVLDALAASGGSLDAPPLATSAAVLAGRDALPALEAYAVADRARDLGACGYVAATIEHLGGRTTACAPDDRDRLELQQLLDLASQIRAARHLALDADS